MNDFGSVISEYLEAFALDVLILTESYPGDAIGQFPCYLGR